MSRQCGQERGSAESTPGAWRREQRALAKNGKSSKPCCLQRNHDPAVRALKFLSTFVHTRSLSVAAEAILLKITSGLGSPTPKAIFITLLFLTLIALAGAQDSNLSPARTSPQIVYKYANDADQKETLLLKDFNPTSMIHAGGRQVVRAKYYVIDVHNHVNDAQGIDDPAPESHRRYA